MSLNGECAGRKIFLLSLMNFFAISTNFIFYDSNLFSSMGKYRVKQQRTHK